MRFPRKSRSTCLALTPPYAARAIAAACTTALSITRYLRSSRRKPAKSRCRRAARPRRTAPSALPRQRRTDRAAPASSLRRDHGDAGQAVEHPAAEEGGLPRLAYVQVGDQGAELGVRQSEPPRRGPAIRPMGFFTYWSLPSAHPRAGGDPAQEARPKAGNPESRLNADEQDGLRPARSRSSPQSRG